MVRKDIEEVLKSHEGELMAIPGVVGIYIGQLPDGKTSCLKVMVVEDSENPRARIPAVIEGHPVVIEESGVLRPL